LEKSLNALLMYRNVWFLRELRRRKIVSDFKMTIRLDNEFTSQTKPDASDAAWQRHAADAQISILFIISGSCASLLSGVGRLTWVER
jgi:hypothetical protein